MKNYFFTNCLFPYCFALWEEWGRSVSVIAGMWVSHVGDEWGTCMLCLLKINIISESLMSNEVIFISVTCLEEVSKFTLHCAFFSLENCTKEKITRSSCHRLQGKHVYSPAASTWWRLLTDGGWNVKSVQHQKPPTDCFSHHGHP